MDVICSWNVANSFIRLSFTEKIYINYEKLNYLIFLLYSNYLYNTGKSLFSEPFIKSPKGPYLLNISAKFGCYDKDAIKGYARDVTGKVVGVNGDDFETSLFYIWNLYKNMSVTELLSFLEDNYPCLRKKSGTVINDIEILNDEIKINEKALEKAKHYKKTLSRNNP